MDKSLRISRVGGKKRKRTKVIKAVVCNLAAWFNAPDIGYQPHYGRKKRDKQ